MRRSLPLLIAAVWLATLPVAAAGAGPLGFRVGVGKVDRSDATRCAVEVRVWDLMPGESFTVSTEASAPGEEWQGAGYASFAAGSDGSARAIVRIDRSRFDRRQAPLLQVTIVRSYIAVAMRDIVRNACRPG